MAFDSSYPEDFKKALKYTISDKDIDQFLKHGGSPRFVYGVLMLPTVLKYYIDEDQSKNIHKQMTQATLPGYQLYEFADSSAPVIAPSNNPKAKVKGMLIFNLSNEERNSIYEFESGLMQLSSVQVDIIQKSYLGNVHEMRKIDAGAFVWDGSVHLLSPMIGLRVTHGASWDVVPYLKGRFYRDIKASQRRGAREKETMEMESQTKYSNWNQAGGQEPAYRASLTKMITQTSANELMDDDDDYSGTSSPKTEIFMYTLDDHEAKNR
ncbi:hypothetical protein N7508_010515 [Penicillium antarcticum]|uniref:uncharacterized protein n=1 Tax=Penicillium antarcticum TaxID=416450 RepID=UPI00238ABBA8|nr:uncharacterized protein N7508_010515 [Penicillium antarcticum]KAJ5295694.1 hypothetical protein N7508_010515 [Penicillium antarcticum]